MKSKLRRLFGFLIGESEVLVEKRWFVVKVQVSAKVFVVEVAFLKFSGVCEVLID